MNSNYMILKFMIQEINIIKHTLIFHNVLLIYTFLVNVGSSDIIHNANWLIYHFLIPKTNALQECWKLQDNVYNFRHMYTNVLIKI